jgi:hypothetical protein
MNNKMKKFNKILMMTVAILLTLVLASTSVVSGIFAKYVVTKSASTEVSLKAFGITLKVEGTQGNIKYSPTGSTKDTAISVSVTDLQLVPNQTLDDVVKFTIAADGTGGKPNVDKVKIKIKTTVSDISGFNVTSSMVDGAKGKNYIPIEFKAKVGTTSRTVCSAWTLPDDSAALQKSIASGIKTNFSTYFTDPDDVVDTVEGVIYDGSLKFTNLSFGFKAYGTGTANVGGLNAAKADEVQTYLSTQSGAKLTVTYTVSLEQVVTN